MLEYGLIIGAVILYFCVVTCTFLAVQIARLKGRRRAWGWLGLLLGPIGVLLVCFIPNAKGVEGETNPVKMAFKKLTVVSPLVTWIFLAGIVLVVGGALVATRLTTYFENRTHEKELSGETGTVSTLCPAELPEAPAALFCGVGKNLAVTKSGGLYGWGALKLTALDESGKLYENAVKAQAVGDTVFVLTKDHTLYARGDNQGGLIPNQTAAYVDAFVKVETEVKDFSVSKTAGALIKESGNLYVFGKNTYGQLGLATEAVKDTNSRLAQKAVQVVVTERSLYYRTEDGNVYATGSNAYGQFGLGNKDAQAAPVLIASACADVAAGEDFTVLLKTDGTVWTAGSDAFGQLGRITLEEAETPAPKEGEEAVPPPAANVFGAVELAGVTDVEAGGSTALALIGTDLYGWGDNRMQQFGNAGKHFSSSPKVICKKVLLFSTSGNSTMVYTEEGKLLGAGDRRYYQLGTGNGADFERVATVKEGNG